MVTDLTGSRYTKADNSVVVPTDTMKQTTYIMAKQHPVDPPELFASVLASHFVKTYKHIHEASVKIKQHRWTRMTVDGEPHPHSFFRDGAETRDVEAIAKEGSISIGSKIVGLLVLKSTGSAFHGFHTDEYTILKPTDDRILSTEIDCGWMWNPFKTLEDVEAAVPKFDGTWQAARDITMKTFANDNSASVQNTMYKMCEQILASQPILDSVSYSLPNKHYFEVGELSLIFRK
jgi:urate oxidase